MSKIQIRTTKQRVMYFLKRYEALRDDDDNLIATILLNDLKKLNLNSKEITAYEFLEIFSKGKLTNPESIRRSRAKLQEEFPELRGKNYQARKSNSSQIRKELGYD